MGDGIWFRSAEKSKSWVRGTIVQCANAVLTLKQEGGGEVTVDPCLRESYPANDTFEDGAWKDVEHDDMCSMMHINEPGTPPSRTPRA